MENIQFSVSAKMARLIGRENISDVDSAVIELIKNAYDADASCVLMGFDMPFPSIPGEIPFELAMSVFGDKGLSSLLAYYERNDKGLVKKKKISAEEEKALELLLFSQNTIIVMDNGHGMDESTLKMAWMNIGTSDKEERKQSPGGRIKTGAKGIGRFALDKLSTKTTVYTKSAGDALLHWEIDWNQFETAHLLSEVEAVLEAQTSVFRSLAYDIAAQKIKSFDEYSWNTGTIIQLRPTREPWSMEYFDKVNRNLKSLFPDNNKTQFDIYVFNRYYPEYSCANEWFSLQESDYDYKIDTVFDGGDALQITLYRNEVDIRKTKTEVVVDNVKRELPLEDFWARYSFQKTNFHRADYAKAIVKEFSASDLMKIPSSQLTEVGPFSAEMYFLKNMNSTTGIIKPIVASRRKKTLEDYSGIKLYRDGFKVRPYGEVGVSFDWIGLSARAQKSPAGVSHSEGSWRVLPYQIMGAVRISRDANRNLTDMANREGLTINDAYRTFVRILEKVIETFEGDRQKPYREYAQWVEQKKKHISKSSEITDDVIKRNEQDTINIQETVNIQKTSRNKEEDVTKNASYSADEYENTVYALEEERVRHKRALQTMMLFSSAGVMTNTFSHEINRIATGAGSRMQHMRESVKRILGKEGYSGDPDFDPFAQIDESEKTDRLLEDWLNVIMNGVREDAFGKKTVYPKKVIQEIIVTWVPLLEKKHIVVAPLKCENITEDSVLDCAEIDFYIILNNFFLNSAWFLEETTTAMREISISLADDGKRLIILLENNGPPLDSSFANNPDRIFDAGVTTKKKGSSEGTGLGLWIAKNVIESNSGQIHPMEKDDGFGLSIYLPK